MFSCSILKKYIAENSTHGNKNIFIAKNMIIETYVKVNIIHISNYIQCKARLHTNYHEWQKESCKGLNYFKTQDLHAVFIWTQNSKLCIYCDHSDF